jgi:hypothetical protein
MSTFINKQNHISTFVGHRKWPRTRFLPSTFRLSTFGLLLTFNFSLIIFHCGLDVEDATPPLPPVWVQKSLPEEWPERGIDAHESGGIFLEWISDNQTNLFALDLYRAEEDELTGSLSKFSLINRISVESLTSSNFIDYTAQANILYYYKMKTVDNSGNVSVFSDSVNYLLFPQLYTDTLTPNGSSIPLSHDRKLMWGYPYRIAMEYYCITILNMEEDLILRQLILPENYTNYEETWLIPQIVELENDNVYKWRVEIGSNYFYGKESAGSESTWATFRYLGS